MCIGNRARYTNEHKCIQEIFRGANLYALPVCSPAISKQCVIRLQCQHNWAVHIVKNLRKFDHVSTHRLSVEALICYHTLCAICVSKQFDFQWISVISKLQKAIKCVLNAFWFKTIVVYMYSRL